MKRLNLSTGLLKRPARAVDEQAKRPRSRSPALLYLLPALLFLVLFNIWPFFFGVYMSSWRWGVVAERFIGLENYRRIFQEELVRRTAAGWQLGEVGQSFVVTFTYALWVVPLAIGLALVLAVVLFSKLPARGLFRTIYFLPFVTSQIAAAVVFRWIFHPQVGLANSFLGAVGLPPQQWFFDTQPLFVKFVDLVGLTWPTALPTALAGPTWALAIIILFGVWSSIGFNVVILLAGMTSIPADLYEVSKLDGMPWWATLHRVTVPLLSPTLLFLLIVSTINAFLSFNAFYILSGGQGGPVGSTLSLPLYIFNNFYARPGETGYAAALSVLLTLFLLTLSLVQLRLARRRVHYQG